MIRVMLADDHKLIREGMKAILRDAGTEVSVIGMAASGTELLALLEGQEADVVLMDLDMPQLNGIEATRLVTERFPRVRVLVLSMLENEQYIFDALGAGARGYLLKSAGAKEVLFAIRTVAEGGEYFGTDVAKRLLLKLQSTRPAAPRERSPEKKNGGPNPTAGVNITPRELEVLQLIAKGYTTVQIAERLTTSKRTVETHRHNLLDKTGSSNTAALLLYAATHRLLE
ncbi:MAG: response regulator transcription factor [Cytophagales bacterium]|nr:response regulator transcription factor [Cytophagales bacterium]